MFFYGILGIFQVLILPGTILIRKIKLQSRPVLNFIAIITTSLTINYCLVFLLTVLGLYTRTVLFLIVILELVWIGVLYHKDLTSSINEWLKKRWIAWKKDLSKWQELLFPEDKSFPIHTLQKLVYILFCLILAFIGIRWIAKLFIWNLGSAFYSYDSLAQWNRWALHWANNMLPIGTWRYPQLLPSNWSVLYLIQGDPSITLFAQAITPLFTMFILFMIIDLGFARKNTGFFLGAAITYLTLKKFLGSYLIEALADMPTAFLAFSSIYFLLVYLQDQEELKRETNFGIIIAISATGCAVTKQIGFMFFLLFSIVYLLFYIRPCFLHNKKLAIKSLLIFMIAVMIVVLPWYLYKQVQIWRGIEDSEVQMIIGATEVAFKSVSVLAQLEQIIASLGKYFYLFIFVLIMSIFTKPVIRGLVWLLVFPLFVSWSLFASYDYRNLALVLPIFSICSGVSIQILIDNLFKLSKKLSFTRISAALIIIFLALLVLFLGVFFFTNDVLIDQQFNEGMQAFSPTINQTVFEETRNIDGDFSIITNYPIETIPNMNGKKISILFNNHDEFLSVIETSKSENIYILLPKSSDQEIMIYIAEKIELGSYRLLLEDTSWIPYMFIRVLNK